VISLYEKWVSNLFFMLPYKRKNSCLHQSYKRNNLQLLATKKQDTYKGEHNLFNEEYYVFCFKVFKTTSSTCIMYYWKGYYKMINLMINQLTIYIFELSYHFVVIWLILPFNMIYLYSLIFCYMITFVFNMIYSWFNTFDKCIIILCLISLDINICHKIYFNVILMLCYIWYNIITFIYIIICYTCIF